MNASNPLHRLASRVRRHLAGGLSGLLWCAAAQAQVGLATLTVGDLPVTLVYPSALAGQPVAFGPFVLTVARDAAPLPGVRRLVVLSHGTGGSTLADHDLAATLARAGFVVAQPLHAGDNHLDASRAGPAAWDTRPQEVTLVIDALARDPRWQPLLALDRVGVHGMSAGGVTALSLAGAQWRLLDLVRHCRAQGDADAGFCYNGLADPAARAARKARYDSLPDAPDAYLPAELTALHGGRSPVAGGDDLRPDPRVAAVTVAVPVAAMFTADSLARLRVPVGVVTADHDTMLLPAWHSARVLRDCRACSLLAELHGAAHMDLVSPWPASVARSTATVQTIGALPAPGFDARQRDAAFAGIAAFYLLELAR